MLDWGGVFILVWAVEIFRDRLFPVDSSQVPRRKPSPNEYHECALALEYLTTPQQVLLVANSAFDPPVRWHL